MPLPCASLATRRSRDGLGLAFATAVLLVACAPEDTASGGSSSATTALDDSGTETSGIDTSGPAETGDDPTAPMTTTSGDSTGIVDDGSDSTEGDSGPDIPPLPPECDGDLLTGDVLLPEEVYLAGTMIEGSGPPVLAHWSTPNDAVAGFDGYFHADSAKIRPTDGRLLYKNTFEGLLREFHCDTCPITFDLPYPPNPLDNDVMLPTPMCDPKTKFDIDFLMGRDGSYIYSCFAAEWYDEAGEMLPFEQGLGQLVHLGDDGLVLVTTGVLDRADGTIAPLTGLPDGGWWLATRAVDDGFHIATSNPAPELWHVPASGEASSLGVYSPFPDGYYVSPDGALDGCGALYVIAGTDEIGEDVILRLEIDGETHVVYSESVDPLVKIHISYLVTGP